MRVSEVVSWPAPLLSTSRLLSKWTTLPLHRQRAGGYEATIRRRTAPAATGSGSFKGCVLMRSRSRTPPAAQTQSRPLIRAGA
jgi:hypothetical protein